MGFQKFQKTTKIEYILVTNLLTIAFFWGGDISQISLIKKLPNDISKQLTMIVLLKSEYTEQHSGVIFGQFIFTLVSAFPITILPLSLRQRHLPISEEGVSHHSDRLH